MTGSLLVDDDDAVGQLLYSPNRHDPGWDRWSVNFADGGRLVVHDPRRLGGVSLDPDLSVAWVRTRPQSHRPPWPRPSPARRHH